MRPIKDPCKEPGVCIVCLQTRDKIDHHQVCRKCRKGSHGNPNRLPAVTLKNGRTYFIDLRLRQLRHVHNPHERIDF